MNDNNDFFQGFESSSTKTQTKNVSTVVVACIFSIIASVIVCSLFYSFINSKDNDTDISEVATSANQSVSNPNLTQVSLKGYSDTAIYAANKVLPSIVSIYVDYEVNYFGKIGRAHV